MIGATAPWQSPAAFARSSTADYDSAASADRHSDTSPQTDGTLDTLDTPDKTDRFVRSGSFESFDAPAHPDDPPSQWRDLARERRTLDEHWRRAFLGSCTPIPFASGSLLDRPHHQSPRPMALVMAWTDATRALSEHASACIPPNARPVDPIQAMAYDNAFAQMTTLVSKKKARATAYETSRLVPVAQRIDEIDVWIDTQGVKGTTPELLEQRDVTTAALVNHDVYFDESIPQILPTRVRRLSRQDDNGPGQSGFFGAAYLDNLNGTILAANRGTEMSIAGRAVVDWKQNILQALGLRSSQYDHAIAWAKALARQYPPSQLVFTGHSLGGGLAAAQTSVVNQSRGVTFDAAGLHNSTVARHCAVPAASRVTAYHLDGEALSLIQGMLRSALRMATRIPLVGRSMAWIARLSVPWPTGLRIGVPYALPPQTGTARRDDKPDVVPLGFRGAIARHSIQQMIFSLFARLPTGESMKIDALSAN